MDLGVSSPAPRQNKKRKTSFESDFHRCLDINTSWVAQRERRGREERKQRHRLDRRAWTIGDQARPKCRGWQALGSRAPPSDLLK